MSEKLKNIMGGLQQVRMKLLSDETPYVRKDPRSRAEMEILDEDAARAKRAGFSPQRPWYHGSPTGARIIESGYIDPKLWDKDALRGPGFYATDWWGEARGYAREGGRRTGAGIDVGEEAYDPRVMSLLMRYKPNEILDENRLYKPSEAKELGVKVKEPVFGSRIYSTLFDRMNKEKLNEYLKDRGIVGIEHNQTNMFPGPGFSPGARTRNIVMFDPSRVRLPVAGFDRRGLTENDLYRRDGGVVGPLKKAANDV